MRYVISYPPFLLLGQKGPITVWTYQRGMVSMKGTCGDMWSTLIVLLTDIFSSARAFLPEHSIASSRKIPKQREQRNSFFAQFVRQNCFCSAKAQKRDSHLIALLSAFSCASHLFVRPCSMGHRAALSTTGPRRYLWRMVSKTRPVNRHTRGRRV